MKNLKHSAIVKFIAWFFLTVSAVFFVVGTVAVLALEGNGLYDITYEQAREQAFEGLQDRHSAMALAQMGEDGMNEKYFADKNFKYGIIEAKNQKVFQSLDLNDEKTYVERNFTEEVELEDLNVFECYINEKTNFISQNPDSLFGGYYVSHSNPYWEPREIMGYVYDTNSGIFYVRCEEERYYQIKNLLFSVCNEEGIDWEAVYEFDSDKNVYRLTELQEDGSLLTTDTASVQLQIFCDVSGKEIESETEARELLMGDKVDFRKLDNSSYGYKSWDEVSVSTGDKESVFVEDTNIETMIGVTGKILNAEYYLALEEHFLYEHIHEAEGTNYYVVSFIPEKLSNSEESWMEGDLYVQTEHLLEIAYGIHYDLIGIVVGCLIICIICFIYLTVAAGHYKGKEEICGTWVEKIPLELIWGVGIVVEVLLVLAISSTLSMIDSVTSLFWMGLAVFWGLCGGWLAMGCYLDFVVRVKLGKWWRGTITWMVLQWISKCMKNILRYFVENTKLFWRVVFVYGAISFAELLIIAIMYNNFGSGFLFFALLKLAMLVVLLKCVGEMQKLKTAGAHLAAGDMEYQIDTEKMYFDFKKHGENLNSLSMGLSKAVEGKMKSERFKTELITNVSHDIKTPLTSIINYVDLLKKEDIQNETAEEYIEVLERQSARLKKLIEDLMEASKASTGNLAVNPEKLEAGVFMVQTVGEFEEKTKASDLELIISKPEEPVYIMADGRHFWRVIDNLMNNICKYAQPGTRVYINLEAKEGKVTIVFRNTSKYALNISSEELMERFVRGDSSRNTEGSGLGLSIARSLMEIMNGTFDLVVDGDLFKVVLTFDKI